MTHCKRPLTRLTLLLPVVLAILLHPALAATGRVALVIGNSTYTDRPLANPVNDAADVAAALGKLGFEVISERNLDRRGLHRALQGFRERLRGKQLGLFFYAGHGAQYQNRNYLIPINADISDTADLPIEALEVDNVLAQMQSAGNEVSVLILDACRNLPYPGANRANDRGLAPLNAIRGSLVAYATSPGKVAQDGSGRNSPYTAALLAEINKPVSLTELFNNVGWAVASSTQNKQEPWYSTSPLPSIKLAQWNDQSNEPAPPDEVKPATAPPPPSEPVKNWMPTVLDGVLGLLFVIVGVMYWYSHTDKRTQTDKRQPYEPAMVRIKAGCFQMGSPANEPERSDDERQHEVCIGSDYEIGQYEVTQGEWEGVMGSNPSNFKRGATYPVENVSWTDIQGYLAKLNAKTGKGYRLPTEAEWEYAARAGTTTAFWTGRCVTTAQANYDGNAGYGKPDCGAKTGVYLQRTQPVGTYRANRWGLHDTIGNVWEWTCSQHTENYNGSEQECATTDTGGPFALRGGSWYDDPAWVRSAYRFWNAPTYRDDSLGFRLARSL